MNQPRPYSLTLAEKTPLLLSELAALTEHHRQYCHPYANILTGLGFDARTIRTCADIPFLPVGLFKKLELISVPKDTIRRTVTSSGTTGQHVSKIALDAETMTLQQQVLVDIVSDFIGPRRLPLLLIDCPSVLKDARRFTARGAGILGFSLFGTNRTFALDDDMRLNESQLIAFLEKVDGKPFLLFGFTFIVHEHLYKALVRCSRRFDLSSGILIHGGGWKKLLQEAVPPQTFARQLEEICGLRRIHDYYGMAEQTGSVFMACAQGCFHVSRFSEVLIRRPEDFSLCAPGETGIIQALSILPRSYPGHSLLTEDEGTLLGVDDCPCGRKGTRFSVSGRLPRAVLRGCSDVYAATLE